MNDDMAIPDLEIINSPSRHCAQTVEVGTGQPPAEEAPESSLGMSSHPQEKTLEQDTNTGTPGGSADCEVLQPGSQVRLGL